MHNLSFTYSHLLLKPAKVRHSRLFGSDLGHTKFSKRNFNSELGFSGMARKFGFFQNEQQVIETIQQLTQEGFVQGDMKILAKDSEHSRRIEAESDIHVDELRELNQADSVYGRERPGRTAELLTGGYGMTSETGAYGLSGYGTSPQIGVGIPFGVPFISQGDDDGNMRALFALGFDEKEADLCRSYLESGSYAIVIETDESKSLLDKDGGPDLSVLGVAEAVFRRCGATRIVNGS